jgi:uncharacterized membrane protein YfcA
VAISGLEMIILALIGSIAGILGGLLGIGGSIVMIPAMLFLFGPRHGNESQHLYQAAAMIVNVFVGISSAYRHFKAGAMLWPTLKMLIPVAIVGSILGVYVSNLPYFSGDGTIWLSRLFGLFLLYVLVHNLWGLYRGKRKSDTVTPPDDRIGGWKAGLIGVPVGLSNGLLGIGGGVVAVPLQQTVLKIPLQRSIANSSACIVFVAIFGAISKNLTLGKHIGPDGLPFGLAQSIGIAAILVPTAFVGAYVGAYLTHKMSLGWLRIAFACLMLYGGIKLITRQMPKPPARSISQAVAASQPAERSSAMPGTPTLAEPGEPTR